MSVDPINKAQSTAASLAHRLCDDALAAYKALSRKDWKGQVPFPGGELMFADAERSQAYLAAGTYALEVNCDPVRAVALLDMSILLDQDSVLIVGDNLAKRAMAFKSLGNDAPHRSILLYHLGLIFKGLKHWREAGAAYLESARLDSGFVWPLNNLAWMAATSVDPAAHNGDYAVAVAERACIQSRWGCKSFLGTLAASYARAGDFDRAVAWQRIAIELGSEGHDEAIVHLEAFTQGRAVVDQNPATIGDDLSAEELAAFDLQALRRQLRELTGQPAPPLH